MNEWDNGAGKSILFGHGCPMLLLRAITDYGRKTAILESTVIVEHLKNREKRRSLFQDKGTKITAPEIVVGDL